jgi:hypothetical protein
MIKGVLCSDETGEIKRDQWFCFGSFQNQATLFYISIHIPPFIFRPEVQVHSDEGLNVYSAVTWGQFFYLSSFNDYCGWMHTSSNVDVADMYAEKCAQKDQLL